LSGFLDSPPATYQFLINGQLAYTFIAAGNGAGVSPASPSNSVVCVPVGAFGDGEAIPLAACRT
jgi:hypothetical protein